MKINYPEISDDYMFNDYLKTFLEKVGFDSIQYNIDKPQIFVLKKHRKEGGIEKRFRIRGIRNLYKFLNIK